MLDQPFFKILGTLLHETAHQWQDIYAKSGKGGYHNQEFTNKCSALGIPCTGGYNSYALGYTEPFITLLREHGVDAELRLPIPTPSAPVRAKGNSKLKKWSCGCTNIRAAVQIKARCLKCDEIFTQRD